MCAKPRRNHTTIVLRMSGSGGLFERSLKITKPRLSFPHSLFSGYWTQVTARANPTERALTDASLRRRKGSCNQGIP